MFNRRISALTLTLVFLLCTSCGEASLTASPSPRSLTATDTQPVLPTGSPPIEATISPTPPSDQVELTATPEARPDNAIPRLSTGDEISITFVAMKTGTDGWAIGRATDNVDRILMTKDGGVTWWDASPPETAPLPGDLLPADVFFLDDEKAWASYKPYEVIWRTTDAGITWAPARSTNAGNLGAMFWFADEEHGWIMKFLDAGMHHTYSALARTSSAGTYWEEVFDPYSSTELQSFGKTGMVFINENTGWVTRDSGGVQPGAFVDVTSDGGFTWQAVPLPPPEDDPEKFDQEYCWMHSPTLFSPTAGALVVSCKRYEAENTILSHFLFSTTDGGINWQRYKYPGGTLQFINPNVAFALDRDIHQSLDGGRTWTKIRSVNWDGQFSFVNKNLAWVVARAAEEIALVKTTDGCQNFTEIIPSIMDPPGAYQVTSVTPTTGGDEVGPVGGGSGQIAFISYRDNPDKFTSDIYLMNIDGSGLTEITDSSGSIQHFSWSPDGTRLVFDSNRDGDQEIFVIEANGTGLMQLTSNSIADSDPDWSPDGNQIAFVSSESGEIFIYVMNLDGSGVRRLVEGMTPAWSPDGNQIAFSRIEDGIYVMDADGTNVTRLTDSSIHGWDYYPSWSPDGDSIIFGSNRHQPGWAATESVYIMRADGSGIGRLTTAWGTAPYAWSPDGRWIVYTEDFGSGATLHIMDAQGFNNRPLMENNEGRHPVWRP